MKTILVLLAVLAMIGFAAAWETTEQMQYAYQKSISQQAGETTSWLQGATSNAGFSSNSAYGTDKASVSNTLTTLSANLQTAPGSTSVPDTHDSLSQGGSATFATNAPDLENPAGVKASGTATTSQTVSLSGLYCGDLATVTNGQRGGVYALFDQTAATGLNGANTNVDVVGNANTAGDWPMVTDTYTGTPVTEPKFSASVETPTGQYGNTEFVEATLGQAISSGFEQLQAVGATPTMSGSQTNYAGFAGAFNPTGGVVQVETQVAGTGAFQMYNTWGNTNPAFTV